MELSPNMTIVAKTFTDMTAKQPLFSDIWIFVFLIIFLIFLLNLAIKLSGAFTDFKYKSLGKLFSKAEHSFFLVLKQALSNDDYEIFAKVRIADVLTPEESLNRRNWNTAFYKISSKHFDYVLCDKNTLAVVAVIELDDQSHLMSKTRARDIFVEKACKTSGLKLIRFPCRSNYHLESIHNKIMNSLNPPV